ncbi:MAG: DNA topoisomerase 3 [Bacteroidaceae bacterium]|nr:DNA topoisomerase 3 [Bacteroidaceae bacterium]
MIVCIAEKPSVAKEIADVLGARSRHDGYYEGNGYQVTWTFGHLCTLKEPHDYTPMWQRWSLSSLPMIPPRFGIKLIDDRGIEKQFKIIEQLMQAADMIVNCGDAGQEGELIQRWVMQKAQAKCPVKRLWVSSLTEEAIREGFATLKDQSEYQSLYEAGLSRAIGDWLLGMNATRLYTLKYAKNRQVLSIGRVQTPTLAMIVKRHFEIENFVPQQYWTLKTLYRDTTFNVILKKSDEELMAEIEKQREKAEKKGVPFDVSEAFRKAEAANPGIEPITSEAQGAEIMERIKDAPFTVMSIEKKDGKELPPSLFDLGLLQTECDRKYGIPIDVTLQTVQSLYEKKVTTYPRVDTTYLSDDIYPKCPNILRGLRDYQTLVAPLAGKPLLKSKKVFDNKKVTDHHAIIPTGVYPQGLTDIEKKVYDLIARRFIAVFHPECKFQTTTIYGESAEIPFKASGRKIIDPGWKTVFQGDSSDEKDEKEITAFTKGESGPHMPELLEKWTQPPKPYTEGTLVRAMETAGKFVDDEELRDAMKEQGIGRPATRAEIIKTLYKRNYIQKVKKNITATQTGIELIATIRNELLKSAELTGQWEKKLRDIEKRQYEAKTFIEELKVLLTNVVNDVLRDNASIG